MSVIGPSDFQGIAGNAQVKLSDQGIVTKSPNFFGRTLDKIHRSDAEKVSNKETRYRFAAMLVDKFGAIAARLAMGDLTSSAMAGKPLTGRHIQNILAQAEALTNRSRKSEAEAVDTIYPRQDAKPGAVLTDVKNASYDKIMSKINQFAGTHGLNPAEIGAIVSYTADPLNEIFNYTNINNALRKTFKTPTPGNDQERVDKQNAEKNFIESAKVARAAMRMPLAS